MPPTASVAELRATEIDVAFGEIEALKANPSPILVVLNPVSGEIDVGFRVIAHPVRPRLAPLPPKRNSLIPGQHQLLIRHRTPTNSAFTDAIRTRAR